MIQQTQSPPRNGLGLTGFILGLVGLLLSFIPLINVVAWPLVVLGIVFASIGIAKASKGQATNMGLAVAGLVLSILGLGVCIWWSVVIDKATDEVNEEAAREVVVVYEVTGDAANVTVDYTTFDMDTTKSNQETVAALPWSKEVKSKGYIKGGALIVTTGETAGSVTCKVTVDGEEMATQTATGPFAIATCGGF